MDGVLTLSHLQDFQLQLSGCGGTSLLLQLGNLSQLKKISIQGDCSNYKPDITNGLARALSRSPQLTHLEVDHEASRYGSYQPVTANDILGKVPPAKPLRMTHLTLHDVHIEPRLDDPILSHLRCLTSLNLSSAGSTVVFEMLAQEKIFLSHIVVGDIDDRVLHYLESCRNPIKQLEMTRITSDRHAGCFIDRVLPKVVDSIQVLKINPIYEGGWCYSCDGQLSSILSQCKELRKLAIALVSFEPSSGMREYKPDFDDEVCLPVSEHV